MKQVYDDETIPLTAMIEGEAAAMSKIKEAKFTVTLHRDGVLTAEPPATVPVEGFPASTRYEFKAKPVSDDLDFYDVSYKVEVTPPGKPALTKDGEEQVRVWPRKVQVKFTSDDSQAHKGVRFRVIQKGKPAGVYPADAEGAWTGTLAPAEFEIEAESPWEITAPTKPKGSKREYKVRKSSYQAAFLSPDPDHKNEAIKQFVNLFQNVPRKWTKAEPYGNIMEFVVEAEGDHGRAQGAKLGKEGDLIHITCEFSLASKRNSPKPRLLTDELHGAVEELDGGKKFKGKVKLKEDGTALFRVDMGLAGGDTCKVQVGAVMDGKEDTLSIENWRKLYYQLTAPHGMTPTITKFNEAMEAAKIVAEKFEEVTIPLEDGPAGSWVNGEDMGRGAGRKLVMGSQNSRHFYAMFKDTKNPVEAHFMFCHFQLDATAGKGGAPFSDSKDFLGDDNDMVSWPGGGDVRGFEFTAKSMFPGFKVFPTALHNGGPSVYEATWSSNANAGPHQGERGVFPADHLLANFKDNQDVNGMVYLKFPADAATVVADGETIAIIVKVYLAKGWYNGESNQHLILIAGQRTKADGSIDWDGINGTMAHEIGHAMNMTAAPKLVIPGIPDVKATHTRWYDTSRGGGSQIGDHCAKGVPQDKYDDPSVLMSDCKGTCVMFGAGVRGRSNNYCELCKPLILAADLSDITK